MLRGLAKVVCLYVVAQYRVQSAELSFFLGGGGAVIMDMASSASASVGIFKPQLVKFSYNIQYLSTAELFSLLKFDFIHMVNLVLSRVTLAGAHFFVV